jgi:two-component system, chemotaxis family, chemotaxis protein CheY
MTKHSHQPLLNTRASVLVIDDHAEMADLISRIVRYLGFEHVDYASSPLKGVLMMSRVRYDLVLSDWHMNPVNGLDLLQFIRAQKELKRTRFLIMTARKDYRDVLIAREAGVDNFLLKPFTPETLAEKISAVL